MLKEFITRFLFIFTFVHNLHASGHFGLSIDEEIRNIPGGKAIRVLFFDLKEYRALEVNYYSNQVYPYILKKEEHDPRNPVRGIRSHQDELQIVLAPSFSTNRYTVISKWSLHRLIKAKFNPLLAVENTFPIIKLNNDLPQGLHYYVGERLEIKEMALSYAGMNCDPDYRYMDAKKDATIKSSSLNGIFTGNPKSYTDHKEKLGEYCTLLTLLHHGYKRIYETKIGKSGFDFIGVSDPDPLRGHLLFIESKWTSEKAAVLTHMDKEMNSPTMIKRLKKLKSHGPLEHVYQLIESFLKAPESNIYKLFYRISDIPHKDCKKRGVAQVLKRKIEHEERAAYSKALGFIEAEEEEKIVKGEEPKNLKELDFIDPSGVEAQKNAHEFMDFLIKTQGIQAADLLNLLKASYEKQYGEFSGPNRITH